MERVLTRYASVSTAVLVKALSGATWFAFLDGEMAQAERLSEECLQVYRQAKETMKTQDVASSLFWMGWLPVQQGNDDAVCFLLQRFAKRLPSLKLSSIGRQIATVREPASGISGRNSTKSVFKSFLQSLTGARSDPTQD